MRRMFRFLAPIAVWLLAGMTVPAAAAPRLLQFAQSVADLGAIRYDGGTRKVRFECENISSAPVSIVGVHAQCGCTAATWSREAIPAGGKAVIDVEYDPSRFIGPQSNGLTVIADNGSYRKYSTLVVKAEVLRDETLEQVRHPHELGGGVRTDLDVIGMRLWEAGSSIERPLSLLNDSEVPVQLKWSCPSRRAKVHMPAALAPGQVAVARIVYDTTGLPEGEYTDAIYIYVDGIRHGPVLLKGAVSTSSEKE